MDSQKMIADLSNAYGASGFEDDVVAVGKKYGGHLSDITEDCIRNLYFWRKENKGDKPTLMLDSHSDEVGFMIQSVKPNGTLKFITLGGWADHTVAAHKVKIRNADGEYISGVTATSPIHHMSKEERSRGVTIDDLIIDVGATSAEEIEKDYKIRIGAPVVPDVVFEYDSIRDLMCGKAFDCRLGCASILEVLSKLQGVPLNVNLVGAFSAQEEMGLRGAHVSARTICPDIAIVFEACPADDTFGESSAIQTALKKGPMLRHIDSKMIANPRFMRFALDTAKKCGISVQEAVRSSGATNGGSIHIANRGVPVIVIGIPVRYIHTHYGIASYSDYRLGVALAKEIIVALDKEIIDSF